MLDQLYADIDGSGFMTPAATSGMNTPFYSHSRSGSAENISALSGVASTAVRPDALSSRLQNLTMMQRNQSSYYGRRGNGSGGNTPRISLANDGHFHHTNSSISMPGSLPHQTNGYFDQVAHPSATRSNPLSRHPSNEEVPNGVTSAITSGQQTPEHIDFSELALNKVPSYSTAVRAPLRNMSYNALESLPNYDMAMSAPPSPTRAYTFPVVPGTYTSSHLSSEPNTPALDASQRNVSSSNLTGHFGRPSLVSRRSTGDDDAERRLHILRARERVH